MKDKQTVRTFIIQNKLTKQQWKSSSGKCAWKDINHAKAAWHNSSAGTKSECKDIKDPCDYYNCGYNVNDHHILMNKIFMKLLN